MEKYNFQAYIVPLDDQGRREWISGFTGSNGDCVVTKDKVIYSLSKCCINQPYFQRNAYTNMLYVSYLCMANFQAALWTDGRYFIEASEHLDCNWILMKSGQKDVPKMDEWVKQELEEGKNENLSSKDIK